MERSVALLQGLANAIATLVWPALAIYLVTYLTGMHWGWLDSLLGGVAGTATEAKAVMDTLTTFDPEPAETDDYFSNTPWGMALLPLCRRPLLTMPQWNGLKARIIPAVNWLRARGYGRLGMAILRLLLTLCIGTDWGLVTAWLGLGAFLWSWVPVTMAADDCPNLTIKKLDGGGDGISLCADGTIIYEDGLLIDADGNMLDTSSNSMGTLDQKEGLRQLSVDFARAFGQRRSTPNGS